MTAILHSQGRRIAGVSARAILGLLFIAMGLHKALDPADFLKAVHDYGWLDRSVSLTWVAALLPWFEVVCGGLLLIGLRIRGTAFLVFGMLALFSGLVLQRALHLHQTTGVPFCGIRFDCGCGNGEVLVCRKLMENTLLMGLSVAAYVWRRPLS